MSRYTVPLDVCDKQYEVVIGYDYPSRGVFWSVFETAPEAGPIGNSIDGTLLGDFMREEIGIEFDQFMSSVGPTLEELLDEDSNYDDLRREMSDEEISKLGLKVVERNRTMMFDKVIIAPTEKPSV